MSRFLSLVYGIVCYLLFAIALLYGIGFVGTMFVPKHIDSGTVGPFWESLIVNVLLLALFAVQHSVMARPAFKRWWTKVVPIHLERSTYVLVASLILLLLYWQWRPMPEYVWSTESDLVATILIVLFWVGWATVAVATFLINHFDLFGLRQVVLYFQGREYTKLAFIKRGFYKYIRHPLMLGFIVAFWATPDMSVGHLLFASVTTVYILAAIQIEEKDLIAAHGDDYIQYRQSVSMLLPLKFAEDDSDQAEPESVSAKE